MVATTAVTPARAEGPVQPIQLQPTRRFAPAKGAMVRGAAGAEPRRYSLDQINILQPVSVTLIAPVGSGLKLVLSKVAAEPLRQAELDAKGLANLKFRTEGGFYAAVHGGPKPVPYQLLVLVGPEEKRKLPSILVPTSALSPATAPAGQGSTVPMAVWLGGAALAGGGLAALWLRRRSS
ncbi:hypothetical protein AACH06_25350 [Ideonella sp. DXS29W]|uniref:LPXTG cell wall anchor domain-containing protein n=1 Tax=Ideonella lacteola TaxID=2984193 RepID=A0ABU9BW17_9BURK